MNEWMERARDIGEKREMGVKKEEEGGEFSIFDPIMKT
jgi:hypothetical protein